MTLPVRTTLVLAASGVFFLLLCQRYEVIQDDVYISMAYSRNLVEGHGLTFNHGERVEGYTNFLWVLLLTIPHLLGLPADMVARVLSMGAGVALLPLTLRLSRRLSDTPRSSVHLASPAIVASIGSLAFWAGSGMETTLFAAILALAVHTFLGQGRLDHYTGALFGLLILTRPEGVLLFVLTAAFGLRSRPRIREYLRANPGVWVASLVGLAHALFRLAYYGDVVPNTFHAKTGLSLVFLSEGLSYAWKFLCDHALWGAGLAVPALVSLAPGRWRLRYVLLLIIAYGSYVTLVGGHNRFFIVVMPLLAAAMVESVRLAIEGLPRRPRSLDTVVFLLPVLFAGASWIGTDGLLRHTRVATAAHNEKLRRLARFVVAQPAGSIGSIACSAIGIPKYETRATVIDLVGLTDRTVAKEPQPLPGIREDKLLQSYNVSYVMRRLPDVVFFITGERPDYPAERALFLSSTFRNDYVATILPGQIPVFLRTPSGQTPGSRVDDLTGDGQFVERYAEALRLRSVDPELSVSLLHESIRLGPKDFEQPHDWLGRMALARADTQAAAEHFRNAVEIDPKATMALFLLAQIELRQGDGVSALQHARRAAMLAPWSPAIGVVHGQALIENRRYSEATSLLRAAVGWDSQSVEALYWLGIAELASGHIELAARAWTRLLERDPGHERARRALASLN